MKFLVVSFILVCAGLGNFANARQCSAQQLSLRCVNEPIGRSYPQRYICNCMNLIPDSNNRRCVESAYNSCVSGGGTNCWAHAFNSCSGN